MPCSALLGAALAPLSVASWQAAGTLPPRTGPARPVTLHNQWAELVPYEEALARQRALHAERVARVRCGEPPLQDALLLLQHAPVYTLGSARRAARHSAGSPALLSLTLKAGLARSDLSNVRSPPFSVHRTERGGEVTYHGPGQLVLYPILDLRGYRQALPSPVRNAWSTARHVTRRGGMGRARTCTGT